MSSAQSRAGVRWVLVANGELPPSARSALAALLTNADELIAVDGGLDHCAALGVWPSTLIGDLDSASADLVADAQRQGVVVQKFPTNKDATDLELALQFALDSGATEVTVVAAFGGRLDHELATLALLAADRWNALTVRATDGVRHVDVTRDRHAMQLDVGTTVSLLPWHGPAIGVTTKGLQWPLVEATLAPGTTHGVSNVAVESHQQVSVRDGVVLVVVDTSD